MRRSKKRIFSFVIAVLFLGGYGIYQVISRVPTSYVSYDTDAIPLECQARSTIVIDTYEDYLEHTLNCEIEQIHEESFFDDNFVVIHAEFTVNRRFKTPRVNKSMFRDGTTITIRLGESRFLFGDSSYRIYEFAFEEGVIEKDTIHVRVEKDRNDD